MSREAEMAYRRAARFVVNEYKSAQEMTYLPPAAREFYLGALMNMSYDLLERICGEEGKSLTADEFLSVRNILDEV